MALTTKQRHFMAVLATATTTTEAITEAGVSRRSAYKWLRDPEFKAELREARRTVFFHSTNQLAEASQNAVSVLANIMNDPTAPTGSRVQAARSILDSTYNAIGIDDLHEQIENLQDSL